MLLPNLVEAVEVIEICEKDLSFDHAVERRAGGLKGLRHVFEDVVRLQLDVRPVERKVRMLARFRRHPCLEIASKLASCKNEIAG